MAWHRATENGFDLTWLNEEAGTHREDPVEGSDDPCNENRQWKCEINPNCRYVRQGYNGFFERIRDSTRRCINKHVPQSHLLPKGITKLSYWWQYNVKLVDAQLSSQLDNYLADLPLKFQNRFELEDDEDVIHPYDDTVTWYIGRN